MPVRPWGDFSVGEPRKRPVALLALVIGLVLLAGVGQLALGPGRTGVTTDEPFHVMRLDSWLDGGPYVPAQLQGLPGSYGSEYVYGPAFSVLAHGANVATGEEGWGSTSESDGATVNRHLVSALIALLAAVTVGLAVAVATGSRLLGFWAMAALLAIPLWTGMGFFNPKDTPVAAGFTLFSAALVLARRGPDSVGLDTRLLTGGLAAGGVFLAVGTRLPMWLPLLVSLIVFGCLAWQAKRSGGGRHDWPAILIGGALGLAAVIVLLPSVFAQPFAFVTGTLGESSDFDWQGVTLTAGQLLSEHPPLWYLPAWAFASTPLLIGLAAVGGMAAAARGLWIQVRGRHLLDRPIGTRQAAVIIFATQLLLLPMGSMVLGSTMYNGLRQHLYIVPAVAALAGIGASFLLDWVRSAESGVRAWLVAGVLALALAAPTVEQLMLFPYNYIYVNPVAGIGGVADRWEGDYWWASGKEASKRVPEGEAAYCGGVNGQGSDPDFLVPCPENIYPYAPPAEPGRASEPGQRWSLLSRRAGAPFPDSCIPAGAVTRRLRGETIAISFVGRC